MRAHGDGPDEGPDDGPDDGRCSAGAGVRRRVRVQVLAWVAWLAWPAWVSVPVRVRVPAWVRVPVQVRVRAGVPAPARARVPFPTLLSVLAPVLLLLALTLGASPTVLRTAAAGDAGPGGSSGGSGSARTIPAADSTARSDHRPDSPVGHLQRPRTARPVPPPVAIWPLAASPRPLVLRGWLPPATAYTAGHRGVDLAASPGTPVRAVAPGRVTFAGRVATRNVITVALTGTGTPPLRLTHEPVRPSVRRGDHVTAGQLLGRTEAIGSHCATGCLHWGLRRSDQYLNPLSLLPPALLRAPSPRLLPLPAGRNPPAPRSPVRPAPEEPSG
ncbi:M23 family metallopeptidase [Streptomyces uncialis]|uniref:M23 family metallopeptidase n=1 Tax=Streptomyces uncialis TaxID=1048205 RepID=UPI0037FE71D7